MRDAPRRPTRSTIPAAILPLLILVAVAACAPAGPTTPTAPPTGSLGSPVAGSPSASPPSGSPSLTPVPGGPTPAPTPGGSPGEIPTTETEWGTILDALPAGFPVYPGSHEADPIDGAASGAFSVPASGETTATWYQAALETAGYSTLQLSGPLEDGQFVIDSEGGPPGCRVQTTIRPLSGTTHVTVLYDAACAG